MWTWNCPPEKRPRHPSLGRSQTDPFAVHPRHSGSCSDAQCETPPSGRRRASRDHRCERAHRQGGNEHSDREEQGEECATSRRHGHSDGSGVDAGTDQRRSDRWESRSWKKPSPPEVAVSIIVFRYHAIRTSFSSSTTSSDVYIYRVPTRYTYFPVVSGGQPSNRTQVFILHPLILGQLADNTVAAGGALHGGATTDRLMNLRVTVAQAVKRAMHTARRSGGRVSLRTFGRAQSRRNIEGGLGRTQLTRLKGQLIQSSRGKARRSGRAVDGGGGSGIIRGSGRGMTIERDLVCSSSSSSSGSGSHIQIW